jgi:hypothetical protein
MLLRVVGHLDILVVDVLLVGLQGDAAAGWISAAAGG